MSTMTHKQRVEKILRNMGKDVVNSTLEQMEYQLKKTTKGQTALIHFWLDVAPWLAEYERGKLTNSDEEQEQLRDDTMIRISEFVKKFQTANLHQMKPVDKETLLSARPLRVRKTIEKNRELEKIRQEYQLYLQRQKLFRRHVFKHHAENWRGSVREDEVNMNFCSNEECESLDPLILVHEEGTLVCGECGVSQPFYFREDTKESNYQENYSRTRKKYFYDAKTTLTKAMLEIQGNHRCIIPFEVFETIRKDLDQHGIPLQHVTPSVTKASLKRIPNYSKYYPCRWSITKTLNPTYAPIVISHDNQEKIRAIFSSVFLRYERTFAAKNIKRKKFFNYLVFLKKALEAVGLIHESLSIPLMKNQARQTEQEQLLETIFQDLHVGQKPTGLRRLDHKKNHRNNKQQSKLCE